MILYNRKKVKYRKDGYCWKKRKDGKTTREDHMKLKVQGVEVKSKQGSLVLQMAFPGCNKMELLLSHLMPGTSCQWYFVCQDPVCCFSFFLTFYPMSPFKFSLKPDVTKVLLFLESHWCTDWDQQDSCRITGSLQCLESLGGKRELCKASPS